MPPNYHETSYCWLINEGIKKIALSKPIIDINSEKKQKRTYHS